MSILVTGDAGYIGSHTSMVLLNAGHDVVVIDNLCNSSDESLKRVAQLTGRAPVFVDGDIRDRTLLDRLFGDHPIDAVLHLAGLKAVGESVSQPLRYYDNNFHGSQVMVRAFEAASGKPVPYRIAPRRPGDIATCYSYPAKAKRELGWKAKRGLPEMMRDAWRWQQMNPNGYS